MAPSSSDSSSDATEEPESQVSVSSIFYVMESFKATATPVSITMVLSALATNFVRTEESAEAREEAITNSYSAIKVDSNASSSAQLGMEVINGLIIIGFITLMTFGVVLLYRYNCMCFLKGYLFGSITFLLGYFGGTLFWEAIQRYSLYITWISYALLIYNFTIVGAYSLFVGKGVPTYAGQGYLIVISVILAWELSHFSDALAWVLLVLLALYDLWAVLAPCGPLNALVKLMGREGAQQLPALLYEAQLPPEARRQPNTQSHQHTDTTAAPAAAAQQSSSGPQAQPASTTATPAESVSEHVETTSESNVPDLNSQADRLQQQVGTNYHESYQRDDRPMLPPQLEVDQQPDRSEEEKAGDEVGSETVDTRQPQPLPQQPSAPQAAAGQHPPPLLVSQSPGEMVVNRSQDEFETIERPTGTVPLAIAKLYKLPLVDGRPTDVDYSVHELKSLVDVYYPRQGGRMERLPTPPQVEPRQSRSRFGLGRNRRREETLQVVHYNVVDRNNVIKRTIFVGDEDGKVYRVLDEEEQEEQERATPSSIKLGLGDFIFYSVLVSKASTYSFATFAACMIAILAGLLLTLLLLAIRGKALPALPISIFLGVIVYLPTRYVLEPFIHNMHWAEIYF